jgi:C-terminal processing protease CtpA/Prc
VEHTDQDSRAANTGVLPGDEILSINTNPVASMSHAQICANMRGVQVLHIKRRVHSDQSGVTLHNCIIERKQGQPLGVGFETTNPGMQRYRNWISSVVAGSLGDQAGLQPDDVLLSINDTSVTSDNGNGMVHEDVVRLFSSSEVIQITYERPCHTAFHHQGEIGHKFEAVIDRMEVTDAVGITIAALDSGDTALSQVNPDGLGAAAGLHVGDEILKVNGFAINGLPHAQILNMIRKNKTTYIEAVRFGEGQDRVDSWLQNKGEDHIDVLNFTLVRATEHDSFGFAISQDHSMANPPHVVELVNRKTVSEGKLMVGDEVSKVNGLSVTGMGHDEVVKRMRFNTHKLDVEVKRHKDRKFMHIAHNHQTVTLKRERLENCSFGFSLALYEDEGDGADVDREQHKIEIVKEGGLADGLLEVGDELLEINGLIVQQMNHDDVIEQVVSSLELTLVVERSEGMHVLSRPNTSTQWGVSFETGENPDGTTIGHFVKKLEHGGIADKAGVFIDAEVVVVNGKNVRRLTHMQFVQYFRSSLEVAMQLAHNKHGTFQQETMDIMIEKNVDDPFGFMLNELQDGTHHVHEVVGGSVAHNKLVMNDELYAINGTPTKGLKHEAVVGLLQDAAFGADGSYVVELQVGRHVGATPPAFGELVDDEFDATAAKVVEVANSSAGPVADEDAEEYGEVDTEVDAAMARSLARAKAAAPAPAPAPAAPVEEGDDEDLPPPPTSPISNFVEPPAKVQSAFKEKLTARRLASGASVNTETLASTPLKERIQQRQQDAAAKTVAANGGTAVELGAVESVEAVSPERKATADAAFQQTFGHLDTPPTTVL